jgi:hypothetical protein
MQTPTFAKDDLLVIFFVRGKITAYPTASLPGQNLFVNRHGKSSPLATATSRLRA